MAVGLSLFESCKVSVDHCFVALEREDEGHVDRDTCTNYFGDGVEASQGCRDLDKCVGLVDLCPETLCFLHGARSIVSKGGGDLDRNAAVDTLSCVKYSTEDVAGICNVIGGDVEHSCFCICTSSCELLDLCCIALTVSEGAREDGGVGGHTNNVLFSNECLKISRGDALT